MKCQKCESDCIAVYGNKQRWCFCTSCKIDQDTFWRFVEDMDKTIPALEKERDEYVHKAAQYKIEMRTIIDSVRQARKAMGI